MTAATRSRGFAGYSTIHSTGPDFGDVPFQTPPADQGHHLPAGPRAPEGVERRLPVAHPVDVVVVLHGAADFVPVRFEQLGVRRKRLVLPPVC